MRFHGSVRLRITAAATLGVAVTLGALALWLAASTADRQLDDVDAQLQSDARVTQRFIRSREPVPDLGPTGRTVQVVDADGRLIGSNEEAEGYGPLLVAPFPWEDHPEGAAVTVVHPDLGRMRVWATALDGRSAPWVVVGRSIEQLDGSVASLRATLVVVVPLLALAVGALTWLVVGRALRPVEAIRSTVSEITEHDLSQRLATTGTGDEVDRLATTMNGMLARLDRAATGRGRGPRPRGCATRGWRRPPGVARARRPDPAGPACRSWWWPAGRPRRRCRWWPGAGTGRAR